MTRLKRELLKAGVQLEESLPYMPYDMGSMTIEAIIVNAEKLTVTTYWSTITQIDYYDRNLNIIDTDWE